MTAVGRIGVAGLSVYGEGVPLLLALSKWRCCA